MISRKETEAAAPVLIDTPIWKAYFRKDEKVFSLVNQLMDRGRVRTLPLIAAELVVDAPAGQERKAFRDFLRIFPILREPENAWIEAALWALQRRKRGTGISLRNAYVAWIAKSHGVRLWTGEAGFPPAKRGSIAGPKIFSEREDRS